MDEQKEPEVIRDEKGYFVKGTPSPNPGGRPKGSVSLSTYLRQKLAEMREDGKTNAQVLIEMLYQKALTDKDDASLKLIFQYMEGMPRQRIGLEGGEEGSPIVVTDTEKAAAESAIKSFLTPTPELPDIYSQDGHPDNSPG